MKTKPMDNVEFVTWLMNYSSYGALVQAFIIESISRYANEVAENEKELRESMKNHIINPDAWVGIGKELSKKILDRNKT